MKTLARYLEVIVVPTYNDFYSNLVQSVMLTSLAWPYSTLLIVWLKKGEPEICFKGAAPPEHDGSE